MRTRMPALVFLSALLALGGRQQAPPGATAFRADKLVVRSGTSFGMCDGYCATELSVTAETVTFTRTSRDPQRYPEQTLRRPTRLQEWEALQRHAGSDAFFRLDSVYGCPDCADGGAEWIELERDGRRKRVSFEYGAAVERIEGLQAEMRALRTGFAQQ